MSTEARMRFSPGFAVAIRRGWPWRALITAAGFTVCTLLSGCQTTPQYTAADSQPIPTREMQLSEEYQVEAGDRIRVTFRHIPDLNAEVLVRPDGRATFELVHDLPVAGLTIGEIRDQLTTEYLNHVQVPELTVALTETSTQRVFVGGEVVKPGVYEANGGLTLLQSLFMAGGYTPKANIDSVVVLRDKGEPVLDYYIVNVGEDLSTLQDVQALRLQGNDIVFVPPTKISGIGDFLNQYLRGVKEILGLFNFTVTYELRDYDNR